MFLLRPSTFLWVFFLDYKYNPDHDEPVDQTYLPTELQNEHFWLPQVDTTKDARPPPPPPPDVIAKAKQDVMQRREKEACW